MIIAPALAGQQVKTFARFVFFTEEHTDFYQIPARATSQCLPSFIQSRS